MSEAGSRRTALVDTQRGGARGATAAPASEERRSAGATAPRRVAIATYRLQFHQGFRFADAAAIVPYLSRLGVSDCYASPYFAARPGSGHGYDVCDHNRLNPELGTEEEYDAFVQILQGHGMGQLLDFVPNHMGVDTTNPWWRDVLENGPSSPAARFFDIDWTPMKAELQDKVLLPILGDQYGNVLERGELSVVFEDGRLEIEYGGQRLPLNPREMTRVLRLGLDSLRADLGDEDPYLREFLSILSALQNLAPSTERDPERVAERVREKEVARGRLARLVSSAPRIDRHIQDGIAEVNGQAGRPESFDRLHELLEAQPYRLSYWRTASHEINYRRFFDVNDLAGLRVEDPEVFAAIHRLLAQLIGGGIVTGLRIDHPDGLFDPARYCEMLQGLAARARDSADESPGPMYVVVEKILSGREQLPPTWAVHGTTGYNFLNELNGLFVDASNAKRMRKIYAKFTGRQEPFDDVVYASKKLIMDTALASELAVLAHTLERIAEGNRRSRDFTLNSLRDVILEIVACFPVYRTYVDESGWTAADRAGIETAIARARHRNPAVESSIFDFLREVLLPRPLGDAPRPTGQERREGYAPKDEDERARRIRFAMKFQQYTGPVQAKGVEDTAFYRYNALLSINEVGGDPSRIGRSEQEFHETAAKRLADWPYELSATATHDTKLGEDVRARINVISELPDDWRRDVSRWMRLNRANRRLVDGEPAPDRNDEYRFYQALAGVWPPGAYETGTVVPAELVTRLRDYMVKSAKEAKVHTSWINPNQSYDEAVAAFVERALTGPSARRFLSAFLPLARRLAQSGMLNSLAQVVIKACSPGVPDFYQGSDFWDLNLVDPDNRTPVDFGQRVRLLEDIEPVLAHPSPSRMAELLNDWPDSRIKLFVTAQSLRLRRAQPELFLEGDYVPLVLEVTVPARGLAFARTTGSDGVIAVVPRLVTKLATADRWLPLGAESWKTSRLRLPAALAGRTFRNIFTGEDLRAVTGADASWLFLGQIFQHVPVAILRTIP